MIGYNMFAYCGNNPINRADPGGRFWKELWDTFVQAFNTANQNAVPAYATAGIVSQIDTIAPGPADVVAAGIALGTLFTCAITAVIDVITAKTPLQSKEEEKVATQSIAIAQETRRYQYWEAARVKNEVVIGKGLTFSEAKTRVASGFDIMCANQGAALWLVVTNGYWNAVGPEIHGDSGYFWHYHPHRNSHLHIWYY